MKLVLVSLLMTCMSWASPAVTEFASQVAVSTFADVQPADLINWKVGDKNVYSLDVAIIKGSMDQTVRSIDAEGIWVDQNMDLGFMGKQQMSQLIDPATGQIKKLIVNGKEEQIPDQGEQEVIDVQEGKITVPAGTFECIHAKIKDKKSNDVTEAWINPELVSIGGMLKVIQPSQMGKVTIALKSFKKN